METRTSLPVEYYVFDSFGSDEGGESSPKSRQILIKKIDQSFSFPDLPAGAAQ
jgi:hypothetical protein